MKKVLSTKTLDSETLAFAQTLNLDVQCVDFIETRALSFNAESINQQSIDALAFTSANAVRFFFENKEAASLIKGKSVFALQGKTKEELEANGAKVNLEAASAIELANEIVGHKAAKSVLHICGNLRLPALENKLKEAGIAYTDLTVYETNVLANKKVNEAFDAILFFSPSGVEGFMAMNSINDEAVCCCIGQTTANALKEKKTTVNIIIPNQASPKAMLTAVSDYFNNN